MLLESNQDETVEVTAIEFPPLIRPHPFVSVYFTREPAHPYLGNVGPHAGDASCCEAMWLLCTIKLWDVCWRWRVIRNYS